MSFINDIAFVERVDELEVEGNLTVGGDILLQGEFPKIDQKIVTATNSLNSSISLKANQSDLGCSGSHTRHESGSRRSYRFLEPQSGSIRVGLGAQ